MCHGGGVQLPEPVFAFAPGCLGGWVGVGASRRGCPCLGHLEQVGVGEPLRVMGRCPGQARLLVEEAFLLAEDTEGVLVGASGPAGVCQRPALPHDPGPRAGERGELGDPLGALARRGFEWGGVGGGVHAGNSLLSRCRCGTEGPRPGARAGGVELDVREPESVAAAFDAAGVMALERTILRGSRPKHGTAGLQGALATIRNELANYRANKTSSLHHSDPRLSLTDAELDAAAALVAQEDPREPVGNLLGHLEKVHQLA